MKYVFAWFALVPMVAFATTPAPGKLLPARVEHAITNRIQAGEYPTLVIAVIHGKHSHVYSFGSLGNGMKPTADTVFEIGSVTKTFTATLLAHDVRAGSLKLDEPVAKLLPGFTVPSRDGKQITLENLATQHSGLTRLPTNLHPADMSNPYADYDGAKLKAFLAGYHLTRDPGSAYAYSNLGVGLLGYALARHAGMSYDMLLQKRIFVPLGMHSSATALNAAMRTHLATGHDETGKPVGNWAFDALAGAGAIKSTGADMLRYLKANMGLPKTLLYPAMQLAHKARVRLGKNQRIGLVWMTRHDKDGDVVWHNGMTGGYASFIGMRTDGSRGVVVLTNVQQSVDDLGFAALLSDAPLAPTQKQVPMSARQLDAYVGNYRLAPGFILKVFRKRDQLYAQATGQGAFPIFPSATDAFFAKITDIRIDFQRGKDHKVKSLVLHQNGHDSPASRMSKTALEKAGTPDAIHLDTATLKQYVGQYQLAPGMVFTITLDHGMLMAQLSFKRDAQDKVDALVLHQNGANHRAARMEP